MISNISELIEKLKWWEEKFGSIPVVLHVVTNAPIISKGPIDGIHVEKEGTGIKELILFGKV